MDTTGYEVMYALVKSKGACDYENCDEWLQCGVKSYYMTDDMFIDVWYDYAGFEYWGLHNDGHITPKCAYVVTDKGEIVELTTYDFNDITSALVDLLNAAENVDDDLANCVKEKCYKALDDLHNMLYEDYL
jgi:hypothetical protein